MGTNDESSFSTKAGTGTGTAGLAGKGHDHYRLSSLRGRIPGRRRPSPKPQLTEAAHTRPAPPASEPGTPEAIAAAETPRDGTIMPITEIGLDERLVDVLTQLGYPTTFELARTSEAELLQERDIGPARVAMIRDALITYGLGLRED